MIAEKLEGSSLSVSYELKRMLSPWEDDQFIKHCTIGTYGRGYTHSVGWKGVGNAYLGP